MAETVTMPKLGFDMAEGTLIRWVKTEGDQVNKGEVLAEIETDKATVEVESTFEGYVRKLLVEQGSVVPVGSAIAVIGGKDEDISGAGEPEATGGETKKPEQPAKETTDATPEAGEAAAEYGGGQERAAEAPQDGGETVGRKDGADGGMVKMSPLARRMAEENNLNPARIQGSGPGGRVVKKDIEAALRGGQARQAPAQAPAPEVQERPVTRPELAPAATKTAQPVDIPLTTYAGGEAPADQRVELNRLRSAIGRRMVESKQQVPHFYISHEYNVDALMALRKQVNELLPDEQKLSVNDFVVKAVALGLRRYPNINASITEKEVIRHGQVNIGNAVAVPGGLLTVVVKNADMKPLRQISSEIKEMAGRVREGKVKTDDIEGSTFSISNLGMYDVLEFIAIVNPPEAAILAVGTAQQMPVVENGEIKIGWRMRMTISADHRITDGAEAAEFMQALEDYIEHPMRLVV